MKPEDRYKPAELLLNAPAIRGEGFGGVLNRAVESTESGDYTPLTKIEMLELAVDLDNLEELLRLANDGDKERDQLRRWVDRLCQ